MKELVQAALEKLRPMLQADGGDIELVDVIEGMFISGVACTVAFYISQRIT